MTLETATATAASLARTGVPKTALGDGDPPPLHVCVSTARDSACSDEAISLALIGESLVERLREQSSRSRLRELGVDMGYRLEDLAAVSVAAAPDLSTRLAAWLERRLGTRVQVVDDASPTATGIVLGAVFAPRIGRSPTRARYTRGGDGRVRVEAFEFHVAEHCNLRCANCCNMSPLVADKTIAIEDFEPLVAQLARSVIADVVKIMGGEPTLHPQITQVIRILRDSGLGDRVRLFTNGLRLHAMTDDFWQSLDELTISTYASAPVKPAVLAMARDRSRRHDFVLNIKPVDEFSQVLSPRYEADDAQVASTFSRCWLRHRCMVVRDRRFYTCTRAAYAGEFLSRVEHEPSPVPLDRSDDGISIDTDDFGSALEVYLAREVPLAACRYCFGGDGATEPHHQLTRDEAARGVLSRRLAVVRSS